MAPTKNNKTCIFPFNYQNEQYFFCTKIENKLQCLVGNSQFDECKDEKFLISNALVSSGDTFTSSGEFSITVDSTGTFDVKFSSIMFCDDPNCAKALDYIKKEKLKNDPSKTISNVFRCN